MITSTISLVVPAMGDTMAAGRRKRQFIRDDLPAFGGPAKSTSLDMVSIELRSLDEALPIAIFLRGIYLTLYQFFLSLAQRGK